MVVFYRRPVRNAGGVAIILNCVVTSSHGFKFLLNVSLNRHHTIFLKLSLLWNYKFSASKLRLFDFFMLRNSEELLILLLLYFRHESLHAELTRALWVDGLEIL